MSQVQVLFFIYTALILKWKSENNCIRTVQDWHFFNCQFPANAPQFLGDNLIKTTKILQCCWRESQGITEIIKFSTDILRFYYIIHWHSDSLYYIWWQSTQQLLRYSSLDQNGELKKQHFHTKLTETNTFKM